MWLDIVLYKKNEYAFCEVYFKGHLEPYCVVDCGSLLGDMLSFDMKKLYTKDDELSYWEERDEFAYISFDEDFDKSSSNVSDVIAYSEDTLSYDSYRMFQFSKAFLNLEHKEINSVNLKKLMAIVDIPVPSYSFALESRKSGYHSELPIYEASSVEEFEDVFNAIDIGDDNVTAALHFRCDDIGEATFYLLYFLIDNGYKIKKCANCNKYFVPYTRSDALYCNRYAPQDINKNCKEYGAYKQYQENLKNNASAGLYRNIYQRKQMQVRRNPDIIEYKKDFEKFKAKSHQWKSDVKKGIKTEEEFLTWLIDIKEKKV